MYWVLGSQEEFYFGVRAYPAFSGNSFWGISVTPGKYFPGFALRRKIFQRFFYRQQFWSGNFSCGAQSHVSGDFNNSTRAAPHCCFSGTWHNAYATDLERALHLEGTPCTPRKYSHVQKPCIIRKT